MTSAKFRGYVIKYLNNEFIEEQKEEITRKLFGLVKKWKGQMESHDLELFKEICRSVEHDAKFKLPWTVHELTDSVAGFVKLVNKLRDDNN